MRPPTIDSKIEKLAAKIHDYYCVRECRTRHPHEPTPFIPELHALVSECLAAQGTWSIKERARLQARINLLVKRLQLRERKP